MDYEANEIKAGLVVVTSLAILILFLVAIFGIDYGKETKDYITYLKNVPGISEGSLVKFGGMDVGQVTEIALPEPGESRLRLKLTVDKKTPVKTDSKAFITSVGIMADNHIEISAGSADAELLPPGSVLPSKEVLSFSQMAEPLGELNAQMQELLTRVNQLFGEDNQAHIASMLESFDVMMTQGREEFKSVVAHISTITANLAKMSTQLNELLQENRGRLEESLVNIDSTTKEMSLVLSDLRGMLYQLDLMMNQNSSNLLQIMENFQYVSQNLEEFSRIVKERPWLLVRKSAPPKRKIK